MAPNKLFHGHYSITSVAAVNFHECSVMYAHMNIVLATSYVHRWKH